MAYTKHPRIMIKQIPPNPYPQLTPDEVWTAKQLYLLEEDPAKKPLLLKQWKETQACFKMNEKRQYLKDESGNWIKTHHKKIELSHE